MAQGIIPTGLDAATTTLAQDAFTGGLSSAFIVAGCVAIVIAIAAAIFVRNPTAHHTVDEVLLETESGSSGSSADQLVR